MKHEYVTCDRCGKEIKPLNPLCSSIMVRAILKEQKPVAMLIDKIEEEHKIDSATLDFRVGFGERTQHYDLCGKCKQAVVDFIEKRVV